MACMTHWCESCKRLFMDNDKYNVCPYCKCNNVTNEYDEVNDDYDVVDVDWEDD